MTTEAVADNPSEYDHSKIDAVGENTLIHPNVEVVLENKKPGRGIVIGSHCIIYPRNRLVLGDMGANPAADIRIGHHVLINAGGYLSGEGGLVIGDYALIGPNVCLLSAGHRYSDPEKPIQRQGLTYAPIIISQDAWIGGGAVVLEGVTIGEGAVVGAGAVVTRDVQPRAVVVGNPARVVKYRGQKDAMRRGGFLKRFLGKG